MARPIKETPILFGEDAKRFEERMQQTRKISEDEKQKMLDNYSVFMTMMQRGKNMRLKTVSPMTQADADRILCR